MSVLQDNPRKKRKHKRARPRLHPAAIPPAPAIPEGDVFAPNGYLRWKGLFDRAMAAVLMLPGLVVIGFLILLVRLTSRGPGLFRQARVGRGGRIFTIYKIRTMADNAEEETGAVWSQPNDKRTTRVGRVLRRFHLDELPQLLNVIRGDMSFVGPRPERPEFVHILAEAVAGYRRRLDVLPGITGLAQLNLPPDSDLDSVRRKLLLDLEYIERAGLLLDARLFIGTALRLVKIPENRVLSVLRLRPTVVIPPGKRPHTNGVKKPNSLSRVPTATAVPSAEGNGETFAEAGKMAGESRREERPHRKPR